MKKYIVTTTIHEPTKALLMYADMKDWSLIVVGDLKTPHQDYRQLEKEGKLIYLDPDYQEKEFRVLSDLIGWNCIERRNIGFLVAYKSGADIVATIDDDNIPYESWGKNLLIGKTIECDLWETNFNVFDPISVTNLKHLWHRGFPIEYASKRKSIYKGKVFRKPLIQADLWDGDPDIDAIARLTYQPCVKFEIQNPFCSEQITPFNSQNTFLSREVLPYYSVLPHIQRMDDIWGAYILQHFFPNSVVFNKASVYHDRNEQDVITNLEAEILGYRQTLNLINDLKNWQKFLPDAAVKYFNTYMKTMKALN